MLALIGQQDVELDLAVVDGLARDQPAEVLPLVHHPIVVRHVRADRLVEEGLECLHQFLLVCKVIVHCVAASKITIISQIC